MDRVFLSLAGLFGFLGVALGAFGAHLLARHFEALADGAKRVQWWETATQYHLLHAVALGVAAWAVSRGGGSAATASGWLFAGGILLFSGSLYAMALTGIRALGAVTPFGGLLLLGGWLALALAARG